MKHLKKLASVLLALVMAAALMMPAFAADAPTTSTLKVEGGAGHTFTVYPIFTGVPTEDKTGLEEESIGWATGVNDANVINALQTAFAADEIFANKTTAPEIATVLAEQFQKEGAPHNNAADLQKLAKAIADLAPESLTTSYTMSTDNPTTSILTGWCVIVDKAGSNDPTYLLKMITEEEEKFKPKNEESTVTKRVWDKNKGENGDWSDGAVYPEGENIKFRLSVKLPPDLKDSYSSENATSGYNVVLHDKQDAGLTFVGTAPTSVIIYRGDTDTQVVVPAYTFKLATTEDTFEDDCTFEISISNVQDYDAVQPGDTIVVEYTAQLNANALLGEVGNSNEVSMTINGDRTPGDKVNVYELELLVNKTDGDGKPLSGAEFGLFKPEDINADGTVKEGATAAYTLVSNTEPYTDTSVTPNVTWPIGTRFTTERKLEAGEYILVETTVPGDYNKMDNITITITADIAETPNDVAPGALSLKVEHDKGTFDTTGGIISTTIENLQGLQLPETGGIGTTIFYIVGGVLVVGAVVLLITKRRAGADEE